MTLVILAALAQVADGLTFAVAVRDVPIAAEANPIARALMESAGLAGVLGYKAAAVALIGALCYRFRGRRRLVGAIALIGLVGTASNLIGTVTA